jgi:Protein of unknown function (DUF1326)
MTYEVKGRFVEACDCEVICSCWAGIDPDMGSCTGLFGWTIEQGSSDGTDLAGCQVVLLSQGTSCDAAAHMLVMIDGTAAQRTALRGVLNTGPWSKVVSIPSGNQDIVDAKITMGPKALSAKLDPLDPGRSIDVKASYDFTGVTIADANPARLIAKVTGSLPSEVEVGKVDVGANGSGLNMLAETQAMGHPPYIFDVDITRVTAMRGKFHYVHP